MMKKASKNITVVMPIHQLLDSEKNIIVRAIDSVKECQNNYEGGSLSLVVSAADPIKKDVQALLKECGVKDTKVVSSKESDFFTLLSAGVEACSTDYFSILEYDDLYTSRWFNMWENYWNTHEDVSVFLPITIRTNTEGTAWLFGNEIVWANSFSSEMGFVDEDSLLSFMDYTLSGGVFNKEDFLSIGGFKASMSFMYGAEFLLRLTRNKLKCYVVPKEGYIHTVDREGCMLTALAGDLTNEELDKWRKLAIKEAAYTEDRATTIQDLNEETVS